MKNFSNSSFSGPINTMFKKSDFMLGIPIKMMTSKYRRKITIPLKAESMIVLNICLLRDIYIKNKKTDNPIKIAIKVPIKTNSSSINNSSVSTLADSLETLIS